eukprot:384983-Prymnesium_polylepis.1
MLRLGIARGRRTLSQPQEPEEGDLLEVLQRHFSWHAGNLDVLLELQGVQPVAPAHLLAGRNGLYAQVLGLNSGELIALLVSDMAPANHALLNVIMLDAALVIPSSGSPGGFSVVAQARLPFLSIIDGVAALHNCSLTGVLHDSRWSINIVANLDLRLGQSHLLLPIESAWTQGEPLEISLGRVELEPGDVILEHAVLRIAHQVARLDGLWIFGGETMEWSVELLASNGWQLRLASPNVPLGALAAQGVSLPSGALHDALVDVTRTLHLHNMTLEVVAPPAKSFFSGIEHPTFRFHSTTSFLDYRANLQLVIGNYGRTLFGLEIPQASMSSVLNRLVPTIGTGQLHDEWFGANLMILLSTRDYTPPLLLGSEPTSEQLWDPILVPHPGFDERGFLSRVRRYSQGVTVLLELRVWAGCSRVEAGVVVNDTLCEMIAHYVGEGSIFLSAHVSSTSFEAVGRLESASLPLLTRNDSTILSLGELGAMVRVSPSKVAAGFYGILDLDTGHQHAQFGAELTVSVSHLQLTASSQTPWSIWPRFTVASSVLSIGFDWRVGMSSFAMAATIVVGDSASCAP